jgi:uncharacterized metal-binding protein YceD (DUF177 family)
MTAAEFHRPVNVARLGGAGIDQTIIARPAECEAIAVRLRIPAVSSLEATLYAHPGSRGRLIEVEGTLRASVTQTCAVTGENFDSTIVDQIKALYGEEVPGAEPDPQSDWDDIEPIENGEIDIGELAVQHLALALDPYPRKPGAVLTGLEEGEKPRNPFSVLAGLEKD